MPEPIRVGDIAPEALAEARKQGDALGRQRAARKPKTKPTPSYAPKGKTGRPTRLHEALIDRICQVIEDGAPLKAAAVCNGVPVSTYNSWVARGREARAMVEAGVQVPEKERIFLAFLERTEGARDHALVQAVQAHQRLAFGGEVLEIIEDVDEEGETLRRTVRFSKPDRMALEWYLERSHPKEFGTRRLEITGDDGGPIPVEVEVSARDILKKRLGQVATRLGVDETDEV